MMGRGTRRGVGIVLLLSMFGFVGLFAAAARLPELWRFLAPVRWPLLGMVAILVASNVYRLLYSRPTPVPKAKPRPTHLRLVKDDKPTIH
jgi:hypothetical protein